MKTASLKHTDDLDRNRESAKHLFCDRSEYETEYATQYDLAGLNDPGALSKEKEAESPKSVCVWADQLKEIAIEDLSVKHAQSAREEQELITRCGKGSCGKKKEAWIQKDECDGHGAGSARDLTNYRASFPYS